MTAPQGIAYWPGVSGFLSFSMTVGQGIEPSAAQLVVPPQSGNVAIDGDLVLSYGGATVRFRNCRLDTIDVGYSPTGEETWTLNILDRRWKWRRFERISGYYNTRRGEKIVAATIKRPRELATLLLEAMGEKRSDVSALPNDAFPVAEWDYSNPATELASLCDSLGCRLVLSLDDRVRVVKVGQGRNLPPKPLLDGGLRFDPPDPPGLVVVTSSRVEYQADIPLEAVGLDLDGKVRKLAELSYAPIVRGVRDWSYTDLDSFLEISNPKARSLAQQSVYRWFRVVGPVSLPGFPKPIADVSRILPLLNRQCEEAEVGPDGRAEFRPPWLYGVYWKGFEELEDAEPRVEPNLTNKPSGLWLRGFELDVDEGIVKSSEPLVRMKLDKTVDAGRRVFDPILRLRVAVNLRDPDTRGFIREEWEGKPPGRIADPKSKQFVLREDLTPRRWRVYGAAPRDVDNLAETTKAANAYLNSELAAFKVDDAGSISYPGLVPWECDGAIQQVSWSIAESGFATTRVSRNREELIVTPSYKERRLYARIDAALRRWERPAEAREAEAKRRG